MTTTAAPTRLKHISLSTRDQFMLDPSIIKVEEGHNPRDYRLPENRAHLDELKASIRENGTLQPLLVRFDTGSGEAILVDGECRLRANLELIDEGVEIKSVPVVQVKAGDEASRLLQALTANTGKPLSKWEIGTAFQRLIGFGWSEEQIAKRMGQTPRFVKEALELSDAPLAVKQLLSERAVTPSLALDHIRQNGNSASMTLRSAVDAATAKHKGKGKPTAKRAKKSKGIRLNDEETAAVFAALNEASIQKDKKCGDLGEAALAIFAAKGIK